MSRFEQIVDTTNHPELAALYEDMVRQGFGDTVPINWLTSQSTRPDILAGTWRFSKGILLQGRLPATVKQMIAATIAAQNNCYYCNRLHSNTLSMLGVSEEIIESCVNDPDLAEVRQPHRAILQFALKTARAPASITEDDYRALREYSINDEEILEIIAIVAYCNFINTWADVSGIQAEQ